MTDPTTARGNSASLTKTSSAKAIPRDIWARLYAVVDLDIQRQRDERATAARRADDHYTKLHEGSARLLPRINWLAVAQRLKDSSSAHAEWLDGNPPFWARKLAFVGVGFAALWIALYGLSTTYAVLACMLSYWPLSFAAGAAQNALWRRRLVQRFMLRLFVPVGHRGAELEAIEVGEALSARSGSGALMQDTALRLEGEPFAPLISVALLTRDKRTGQEGSPVFLHFGGTDGASLRMTGCSTTWPSSGVLPDNELATPARLNTIARSVYAELAAADAPITPPLDPDALRDAWQGIHLPPAVIDTLVGQQAMFMMGDPAVGQGLLLSGPPGTGKTLIARTFAQGSKASFFMLGEADLKQQNLGASAQAVKKLWENALAAPPSIIFVDECEGVFGRRGASESDQISEEIVRAFLPYWDGRGGEAKVLVVGATNRPELLDGAIRSRFSLATTIPLPAEAERVAILGDALTGLDLPRALSEDPEVAKLTAGCSGRDLADLAASYRRARFGDLSTPDAAGFIAHIARERRADKPSVQDSARWDTLVVAPEIREALQDLAFAIENHSTLQQQGFNLPRGVLLFGPPGTGKTQIARTLANEAKCHFIAASTADLKAGFVGQSGQRVKALFDSARAQAPTILFLDEIDALAADRSGADSFIQEAVTQLLQEMDGVRDQRDTPVIVLAATNRKDALDPALLSRFRDCYEVALPDAALRQALAEQLATTPPFTAESRALAIAHVRDGDGLSHRDIGALFDRWKATALREARSREGGVGLDALVVGTEVIAASRVTA